MRQLIVTIRRPRIAIPRLIILGLVLLQVGLELISWTVLSGLFLLAWPVLTAILFALVGFKLLLKLKSLMYAAGWGVPNIGGPIVTAQGLIFIGATADDYLRAFDIETGEELWKERLPAGGQTTPMTYRVSEDGRQFVVIAAGGHSGLDTKTGDSLVAFALKGK